MLKSACGNGRLESGKGRNKMGDRAQRSNHWP